VPVPPHPLQGRLQQVLTRLATEYGVAYNTIRKSMELLRQQGLIVTMHGRGTFVVPEDQRPYGP
jgi:DNA-binding GntR family transcriptional regulator